MSDNVYKLGPKCLPVLVFGVAKLALMAAGAVKILEVVA